MKYNSIELRPDKALLLQTDGNYEIDSVIGKRTDKTAQLTMIDLKTGKRYIRKYDRTMLGFKEAFKQIVNDNDLCIRTLTMDNGGENNLLWEVVSKDRMFNCHAYCSGEKGTLENSHRLIRRIIPKGKPIDDFTDVDIQIVEIFVNSYFSKTFNVI